MDNLSSFNLISSQRILEKAQQTEQNATQGPIKIINPEIQRIILQHCEIPGIKKMMSVSKHWNILANTSCMIWQKIRLNLGIFPQSQSISLQINETACLLEKNILRKSVLDTKNQVIDCFLKSELLIEEKFKDELNELLNSEQTEDIIQLQRICRARDTLVVWEQIQIRLEMRSIFASTDFNSISTLLEKSAQFQKWCNENQAKLANVELLDFMKCQLTSLPAGIGKLSNLKELALENNKLTSLPAEIGQLSKLEFLNLDDNQLTSLPAEFGQLSKLDFLALNNNQLTSFPAQIIELVSLTSLGIGNNNLTSLPKEISNLGQLKTLFIEDNQLTLLPLQFWQLVNLERLNLAHNKLTSLPKEISKLGQLKSLYLDGNQLTSLPKEISNLGQLIDISLKGNQLTLLPPQFWQFVNL